MEYSYRQSPAMPFHWLFYLVVIVLSVGLMATSHYLYAFVPSLALLSVLLLGNFLPAGYYLIVFLFPFRAVTGLFQYEEIATISVQKIIGLIIVIAVLLLFLFKKKIASPVTSNLWPWLVAYAVVSFLSALMSEYRLESFSALRALLNPYVIFFLTLVLVDGRGFRKTLPAVVIFSVLVNSLLSVVGYFFRLPTFLGGKEETYQRWEGAAGDPNVFSAVVIFCLPLVAHRFFTAKSLPGKAAWLLVFILDIGAILFTFSRGGVIVFALTILFLVAKYAGQFKPRYFGFVSLFTVVVATTMLVVLPSTFYERLARISETAPKAADSIGQRISYLIVGWESFRKHPVFGTGPGTFQDVYAQTEYALEYMKEFDADKTALALGEDLKLRRAAHNTYIEVLVGTGLLGFLSFFALVVVALHNFRKAKAGFLSRGDAETASLVGAYAISLFSLMIYFLFLSTFYHHYFWIALALSQVALRLAREKMPEPDRETLLPAR